MIWNQVGFVWNPSTTNLTLNWNEEYKPMCGGYAIMQLIGLKQEEN